MTTKTLDELKARLSKKAEVISRLFATPDGQEALSFLEAEFLNGELFSTEPLVMAHRIGSRDVVVYIQQLLNVKDKL